MASTADVLVERHRVRQLSVRARFFQELVRLWPLINVSDLDRTAVAWISLVTDLILGFRKESASISLAYYRQLRGLETGLDLPDPAKYENFGAGEPNAIRTSLLVTGPVAFKERIGRNVQPDLAWEKSKVDVAGAAGRHVMNGGRSMLMESARTDGAAVKFARMTGPDPCAFCAMLASRGPVYVESAAVRTTNRSSRGVGEKYHDNCQCMPRPLFEDDPESGWTERSRRFSDLWGVSTKGYGGVDALNAFRRAYNAGRRANESA